MTIANFPVLFLLFTSCLFPLRITIIKQSVFGYYNRAETGIKNRLASCAPLYTSFNSFGSSEKMSNFFSSGSSDSDIYIAMGTSALSACAHIKNKPVFFIFLDYPEIFPHQNSNFYGIANDIDEHSKFQSFTGQCQKDNIRLQSILLFETMYQENSEYHADILHNLVADKYPGCQAYILTLDPGFCRNETDFSSLLEDFFTEQKRQIDFFYITNDGNVVRFMNIILKYARKHKVRIFGNYFASGFDIDYYYLIDYEKTGERLGALIAGYLNNQKKNRFYWEYIADFQIIKKK
ncbi:MAG: hypothetical protein A2096_04910 [Spirochaetes bacterium GWF1_41_5]|nr:MAG: hypothetical protein A2096_04910 [Spirochaetes bacterium GWF1_41_5]HBE04346.1 hypothetical protein [Spirochaetia bacterium]